MTENEAIKAIQNDLEWHSKELKPAYKEVLKMAIQAIEEIQQYRAIGTIEEFKALKEKSVAKKVVYKDHTNCCPTCDYHYDRSGREWIGKNCPNCGQAILRT